MTCIVGWAEGGAVYLGGDSAGVGPGYNVIVRADEKVFNNGEFVMGFTSSFRMGQLLRYAFVPPALAEGQDLFQYMVTGFVDALRECFKQGGYATKNSDQEAGGCFLVGVRGRLFTIESDYQVAENREVPFAAIGCGEEYAHGALYALRDLSLDPRARVQRALETAALFSGGVRGPFDYVRTANV